MGSLYAQDNDFPPVLEEHDFDKHRIQEITPQDLSGMRLDQPRLRAAYYYFFDTMPHHGVPVPDWRKHVYNDMLSRGGDIQMLMESMYRSKPSLSFQKRMINLLPDLPSVDKTRFVPIMRKEIAAMPEKMSVDDVVKSRMCMKLEFIVHWGESKDVEYVKNKVKQYSLTDPLLLQELDKANQREKRKKATPRSHAENQKETSESSQKKEGTKFAHWGIVVAVGLVFCALAAWLKMRSCKHSS